MSNLYEANAVPNVIKTPPPPVNQNKILYFVYFDPMQYTDEARKRKLRFSEDRKYPVHLVVQRPAPDGKSGMSATGDIAVTDDTGKVMILEDKFFTAVGKGLLDDNEYKFSGENGRINKTKLMYDKDMYMGQHPAERTPQVPQGYKQVNRQSNQAIPTDIPLDDGTLPIELFNVPDLRHGKSFNVK